MNHVCQTSRTYCKFQESTFVHTLCYVFLYWYVRAWSCMHVFLCASVCSSLSNGVGVHCVVYFFNLPNPRKHKRNPSTIAMSILPVWRLRTIHLLTLAKTQHWHSLKGLRLRKLKLSRNEQPETQIKLSMSGMLLGEGGWLDKADLSNAENTFLKLTRSGQYPSSAHRTLPSFFRLDGHQLLVIFCERSNGSNN